MTIINVIDKKKRGKKLNNHEIDFVINGFVSGEIADYQMSSLLMAILINDMDVKETTHLTKAMINSGKTIGFKSKKFKYTIDKHSTGGVGDKVSIIFTPLLNALGVAIGKLSGRGLGFTGGTVDKLESIGMDMNHTEKESQAIFAETGMIVTGQSKDMVPADSIIYALRDVTGTVDSYPLIASSIMSKKLALITDAIFIDLKVGSGAFMRTEKEAYKLASLMKQIAQNFKRPIQIHLTRMDGVLGRNVGNRNEVMEAIAFLKGDM